MLIPGGGGAHFSKGSFASHIGTDGDVLCDNQDVWETFVFVTFLKAATVGVDEVAGAGVSAKHGNKFERVHLCFVKLV